MFFVIFLTLGRYFKGRGGTAPEGHDFKENLTLRNKQRAQITNVSPQRGNEERRKLSSGLFSILFSLRTLLYFGFIILIWPLGIKAS